MKRRTIVVVVFALAFTVGTVVGRRVFLHARKSKTIDMEVWNAQDQKRLVVAGDK